MGIQDWREDWREEVHDPRRHTLGGFRAGQGFGPLSNTDGDETLSLEFEEEAVGPLSNVDDNTLDELVAELLKD